jgi:hypothetical protein
MELHTSVFGDLSDGFYGYGSKPKSTVLYYTGAGII